MRIVLMIHLCSLLLALGSFASVRSYTPKKDELVTINSALGIATIVQTPEAIQSAIIGDQSAFRVEYLDRAVTLKPLRPGARTNLYVITGSSRYSLRLVPTNQDRADYIVYIKEPERKSPSISVPLALKKQGDLLSFALLRVSLTSQGIVVFEGRLSAKRNMSAKAEQIWVKQEGKSKVIQHLYLSDLSLTTSRPILVGIALNKMDLVSGKPLSIIYDGQESLEVAVPVGAVWR